MMADDDSAAAQPKPEEPKAEAGTEQKKQGVVEAVAEAVPEASQPQQRDVSDASQQQQENVPEGSQQQQENVPEASQQQQTEVNDAAPQQQTDVNDANPALSPTPLPPTHQETQKGGQPSGGAVRFDTLPGPHPTAHLQPVFGTYDARREEDEVPYEIPHNPKWHKVKIGLMLFAVAVSALVIGLSVATGYISAGDYGYWYIHESAYISGVSASAAILSLVFIVIEMLTMWFSKDHRGLHPGWLITFNLIVGALAVAGFGIMVHYVTNVGGYNGWSRYFDNQDTADKELALFQALLAFDFVLFFTHLVLFVGACGEAHQRNRARREVQIVEIPYDPSHPLPAGFQHVPHPTLQHPPLPPPPPPPTQQIPGSWAPQQPRRQPQRVSVHGVIPYITPEQAAQYGGYYSPMPTPAPPQQPQRVRTSQRGYYAPAPYNPFVQNAPAPQQQRSSMRGARAAAGQGNVAAAEKTTKPTSAATAGKKEAPLPEIPLPEVPTEGEEEAVAEKSEPAAQVEVVTEKGVAEK
ncbi:hypothetical protein QC762_607173 [Podospora pseudocomata]|uniref:MARVEL domain-containing protein n=1 Tax=Podospora pseudocomata TaxID=2093779 RepID=A0ABR0G887_9PEZI|nr:hypothetical protein QC762_607173 [Podospora pseudocomata]